MVIIGQKCTLVQGFDLFNETSEYLKCQAIFILIITQSLRLGISEGCPYSHTRWFLFDKGVSQPKRGGRGTVVLSGT